MSTKSVTKLREWIRDCVDNHAQCEITNNSFVPTRLLDVRRDGIILRDMRDEDPIPYVALSHCWGAHSVSKPRFVTDSSTITERLMGIEIKA